MTTVTMARSTMGVPWQMAAYGLLRSRARVAPVPDGVSIVASDVWGL
jgi:hypothetical protein